MSEQKQIEEICDIAGGVQPPCTSNSLPHCEAQDGRPEVKGTISPSADCWAEMSGRKRLESVRMI